MADERDRLRTLRRLEAETKAAAQLAADEKAKEDAYYTRDPKTGLSPAQVEAQEALAATQVSAAEVGVTSKLVTPTGSAGKLVTKPTPPPSDAKYDYDYVWVGATTGKNIGNWKLIKKEHGKGASTLLLEQLDGDGTPGNPYRYKKDGSLFNGSIGFGTYKNGVLVPTSGGDGEGSSGKTVNRTEYIGEGANRVLRTYYSDGTTSDSPAPVTTASTVVNPNVMTAGQQDVYSIMVARLNQYNLGALAPLIRKLAIEGATEATIMLQLSEEPLYKQRFKANQARIEKGLTALSPSDYLRMEDTYRQILRAYGLTQFDNDDYVSQFIAKDISATELSNRVVTAVQRVRNADPAVTSMLRNFYGIGQNDLVAYVLDPEQQFQKIERQVAASEIGVAAARQGFNIGATVAEQLAAQGITQAEAQRGYSTIADILPTAEKLSDIYGGAEEEYRLPEAEQEVFNQLASAQRKRQRLIGRETAAFSGTSGLGRTSLTQQAGGQF